MSIITISRGSYSRGKEVAEALAEELCYTCISREILFEASRQFNIPEIKLAKALHDAPMFIEHFQGDRRTYLDYIKSSFFKFLEKGNVVYHGLAGHFFVQGISHALKVRINAQMDGRIAEEMKRESCSELEAAVKLKKDDLARRKWGKQFYGIDTADSRLYDIVLCVDSLTVADIVELLVKTVQKEQFRETIQSLDLLRKRALEAKVKAITRPVSPHAQIQVINQCEIHLSQVDGLLKSDPAVRHQYTQRIKKELDIAQIHFSNPVMPSKSHINTFYNI